MAQQYLAHPVRIRKVEFKGQVWIGVELPKRADYIAAIRLIEGRIWKREFRLWLIPYSKEAWRQLKDFFPDLVGAESQPSPPPPEGRAKKEQEKNAALPPPQKPSLSSASGNGVIPVASARLVPAAGTVTVRMSDSTAGFPPASDQAAGLQAMVQAAFTENKILLRLPKNEQDIAFLRTLQHTRWDPGSLTWQVTASETNAELIRNYFGARLKVIAGR